MDSAKARNSLEGPKDNQHNPAPLRMDRESFGERIVWNRLGRGLVAWLVASSLLISSTAAIVHTHEHSPGHDHEKCSTSAKPIKHPHAGCKHRHPHAEPVSQPESPQERPIPSHSHDDCSFCQFLMEHVLPTSRVEVPLPDVVLEFRPTIRQVCSIVVGFNLPPARGPPCAA